MDDNLRLPAIRHSVRALLPQLAAVGRGRRWQAVRLLPRSILPLELFLHMPNTILGLTADTVAGVEPTGLVLVVSMLCVTSMFRVPCKWPVRSEWPERTAPGCLLSRTAARARAWPQTAEGLLCGWPAASCRQMTLEWAATEATRIIAHPNSTEMSLRWLSCSVSRCLLDSAVCCRN